MKLKHAVLSLCLFLLSFSLVLFPPSAQGQSPSISRIYLAPVATCCSLNGTSFWVSVMVNLTSGEVFNTFDVRLNYTGFYSPSAHTGLLQGRSIDYSGNVFGASGIVATECVDGVQFGAQGSCETDDSAGQVHLVESNPVNVVGPLTGGLLFKIQFGVFGNGTSILSFNRANLINPVSGSGTINPHNIQLVTGSGVFGNTGLVAFFNFEPSVPPVILPSGVVLFDAGASFNGTTGAALAGATYVWDFGDGGSPLSGTSPTSQHVFRAAGSYNVKLNVTDASGKSGLIVRRVVVLPALGGLDVTVRDERGTPIRGGISVLVFNSTLAAPPFFNKTISQSGEVLFSGLTPASYFVKFVGSGYRSFNKTEDIMAGWTTQDSVYLQSVPVVSPPPDYGSLIFAGTILAGVAVALVGILVSRRRSRMLSRTKNRSGGL